MKHLPSLKMITLLIINCFPLFAEAQREDKEIKFKLPEIRIFSETTQEYLTNRLENLELPHASMACTPITNDNCANAWTLNVGTGSIGRTTCNGTLETSEDIACGFIEGVNQSVWFKFTAQNIPFHTVGVVEQNPAGNPCTNSCTGCYITTVVWESNNGACPIGTNCKMISCQSSINGPRRQEHVLPGLTPNAIYYVQVMYKASGTCGDFGNFNIFVSNYRRDTLASLHVTNPNPYSICTNAPLSCNISSLSQPNSTTILSNCSTTNNIARDTLNSVVRECFLFNTNNNTNVNFSNYISSNCIGGNGDWDTTKNISWGYWNLLDANCNSISCGFINESGIISISNLLCNTNYKICLQYEIKNCNHFDKTFYIFAPNLSCSPLPVELIDFNLENKDEFVIIKWETSSEINSDFFIVEKSFDGHNFEKILQVPSKGSQSTGFSYEAFDTNIKLGLIYYRLKEQDQDGNVEKIAMESVWIGDDDVYQINQSGNLININSDVLLKISLINNLGQIIYREINKGRIVIDVSKYNNGIYLIYVENPYKSNTFKINR